MDNALYSIAEIEERWSGVGDRDLNVALDYQRLWTLFAGLVNAVALGDIPAKHRYASSIHAVALTVPLRAKGGRRRRAKSMAFRIAPLTMARLGARRGKFARQVPA